LDQFDVNNKCKNIKITLSYNFFQRKNKKYFLVIFLNQFSNYIISRLVLVYVMHKVFQYQSPSFTLITHKNHNHNHKHTNTLTHSLSLSLSHTHTHAHTHSLPLSFYSYLSFSLPLSIFIPLQLSVS